MLGNPIKPSKKEYTKQLIVFISLMAIVFVGMYLNKIYIQVNLRKTEFSGIVTHYKYIDGRGGYYYYTEQEYYVRSYYFFYNYNTEIQLNIGDSIYKAPDSFRLYIYKKDGEGKYVLDRMEMKFDDSVSPYTSL